MTRRMISLVAIVVALGFGAAAARASFVQWNIDPATSKVTLAIPDQQVTFETDFGLIDATVKVRNQTGSTTAPWTLGSSAFFDGLLNSNYSEGADHKIEFLANPTGQVLGLTSGNYRPNPASFDPLAVDADNPNGKFTDMTTAAAVFAARIRGDIGAEFDIGYLSFYNSSFDLTSSPLTVAGTTGGAFNAVGAAFGMSYSALAADGVSSFAGQPLPDTIGEAPVGLGSTSAATATITNLGGLNRRLNLNMTIPASFDFQGTALTMTYTVDIVATGVALFPGDANASGVVDFTDLGILLNNYNLAGTFATGDFDHTNVVDFTDLGILLNNYNVAAPVLTSAAPVPEPSTLLLAGIGLCAIGVAARRRVRLGVKGRSAA